MKLKQSRSGQYTLTVPVTVAVSEKTAKAIEATTRLIDTAGYTRGLLVNKAMGHSEDIGGILRDLRGELATAINQLSSLL